MAGTDKTGKSRKIGRSVNKCSRYRARNNAGTTPKARRVLRALLRSPEGQIGWYLTQDKKRALPIATSRKKRHV